MAVTPWFQKSSGLLDLWDGSSASMSTPTVGEINGTYGSLPFTIKGIGEKWERPSRVIANLDLSTSPDWSIDSAVPAPAMANNPDWSSSTTFSPSAQFTDHAAVAAIQDWIVLFAVGLGVGGGLASSLLFEYLRAKPEKHVNQSSSPNRPEKTTWPLRSSSNSGLAWIGAILFISYILRRRRS